MLIEKYVATMSLPRYAILLEDEKKSYDDATFFQALSQLDARDSNILQEFMDNYRNAKIKVFGLSECLRFHERVDHSPEFEQFSIDLWREFYIQEDFIQIAVLDDKEPIEVDVTFLCCDLLSTYRHVTFAALAGIPVFESIL